MGTLKANQLQSSKLINSIKLKLCYNEGNREKNISTLKKYCLDHQTKYNTNLFPKHLI